jgi:asparagine synthase (glutamine-hydrolysing)
MAQRMAHRGPDAQGVWVSAGEGIALSHRRLSVIDLDPRSNQPMHSDSGQLQIVFNGEIYNYRELRTDLEKKGLHEWRTTSDTEVLLRLYETHGPARVAEYLNQLRGQFGIALWDGSNKTLLLARDPTGKKPVFYCKTRDGIVFGSTIKGILEDSGVSREVNELAIQLYLRLGYIPAPYTAFKGIHKLPAAHFMLADAGGIRQIGQYWSPDFNSKLQLPEEELKRLLLQKLEDATRLRMISDVPLGAFLSGGIDSSAIVAMMSRLSSVPVKTFCVGFKGYAGDEAQHARQVADRFGCDHTELQVEIKPDHLPELVDHFEEPFSDAAAIPTYFMSQIARQHVTVVLNGDGGDENFAGYTLRHLMYSWAEALRLPNSTRRAIFTTSKLLPARESESSLAYRLRKSIRVLGSPDWQRNVALMELFGCDELADGNGNSSAKSDAMSAMQFFESHWEKARAFTGLDRELYFSFALHLPEQLLVKVDRASMAWALEARSPLLDREFVDFCARIPVAYKLRGRETKSIFKRALAQILPENILHRPKQGFIPPLGQWLRFELRSIVQENLLAQDTYVSRVLNPKAVQRIVREHLDGHRDHQRKLYTLLNLELWHRQFVRRN